MKSRNSLKAVSMPIRTVLYCVLGMVMMALVLTSCRIPGMRTQITEQGNLVTQAMVDELKPGMTKAQVEFVLGTPVHRNTFNVNEWTYIYTLKNDQEWQRKVLVLTFEDDRLVKMVGDYFREQKLSEDEDGESVWQEDHSPDPPDGDDTTDE